MSFGFLANQVISLLLLTEGTKLGLRNVPKFRELPSTASTRLNNFLF